MTPMAQALTSALLHFLWQGIAAALLLAVALLFLRRSSPGARYVASCIVLALLAIAPVITMGLVYPAAFPPRVSVAAPAADTGAQVLSIPQNVIARASVDAIDGWILPLWTAGVFLFGMRLVWAGGHASVLRRQGVEADSSIQSMIGDLAGRLGIRRRLQVMVCSLAEVPSVVGWIRPVILVPASVLVGLTPQQLEALLAHELAHIRRHDYLVNILQMVVETLLFYHPAVWWISGRIRHERELCCDDIAVAACGNAVAYARALTQLEKLRPVGPSLVMGSAGGGLYRRVQRLLGCRGEDVPSRLACAIGLVTGVLCLGWVLQTANAEQPSQVPLPVPEGRSVPAPPIPPRLPAPAATAAREATPAQAIAPIAIELPTASPAPAPVSAAPVPPTLTVPALAAPVLPLPPAPISRMPPSAAPVPALPSTAVSPRAIPSVQAPSPSPWVLFRGNDVIVRGNRADEEQARRAHLSFKGDLLWFRLDGKAYTTQDRETLDQMLLLGVSTSVQAVRVAGVNVEQLRQEAEGLALASDQRRILAQLQVVSAQLQSNLHEMDTTNSVNGLLQLRANMAQLQATTAQLQKAMVEKEIEIEKFQAELLQMQTRRMEADESLLEILRGVVRTGKAQPTP